MKIAIVGAGFSGAVLANQLAAQIDCHITMFDERDHIGGNCHTTRDGDTSVMVHHYGPHIFHTDDQQVWEFITQFAEFMPFTNRVKAVTPRGVFSLPINLMTINQFFGKNLRPNEALAFIQSVADQSIDEPENFEEQALKFVGHDLYEAFFKGYTLKQWGIDPKDLPASILKRLPIRFNYDDNYYNSTYQAIPREGYTAIIQRLIDNHRITLKLNHKFSYSEKDQFNHVFYTGPIDALYGFSEGELGYRTVYFEREVHADDYQGNAVINYTDAEVPFTRIAEHKHFTPWESHDKTVVFKEYSKFAEKDDIPYYPISQASDKAILSRYQALARQEQNISFVGRLATYRYLDMDKVIGEALRFSDRWIEAHKSGAPSPVFSSDD